MRLWPHHVRLLSRLLINLRLLAIGSVAGDTDVLLAEAVGSDGAREGSSSEDTDDETYLRRHHDMEERERAAVTERANKTAEKRRAQQQQSLSSKGHDPSRGGSNGPLGKPGFAPVWSGGS